MRRSVRLLTVPLGFLLVFQIASCARVNGPEPGVRLTPCRIDGFPEEIKCTTVSVPESRIGASDRRVSIHVAIVPALARVAARDPLVLLAGGPGQAASAFGPWITSVFAPVRRHRDILLIDQRGTGLSQALRCRADESSTGAPALEREERASRECLASLDGDPRHYANGPAMEDLDEIRAVLGYTQLNLWGGSYGTRAALVYMRAHPERVRSAVLDGVAPWSLRFPLHSARDGERALDRLLDDCASAPECATAFPSLRSHLADLLRRLSADPADLTTTDPRTGAPRRVRITRDEFAVALRGFLYIATLASTVPLMIERAYAGDFGPFLALGQTVAGWSMETMSLGMTRSVLCSEDLPRIIDYEIDDATRGTTVGRAEVALWRASCAPWPRATVPADASRPVRFDGPVLLLSGDLDPVVPPQWAEEVRATMPRARHLIAPGVGHNVTPAGCAPELVAAFIERADATTLDAGCLTELRRPPFVTSPAGWRP
jgi:pimeloyl-ACP methyl ester carboxylesterase